VIKDRPLATRRKTKGRTSPSKREKEFRPPKVLIASPKEKRGGKGQKDEGGRKENKKAGPHGELLPLSKSKTTATKGRKKGSGGGEASFKVTESEVFLLEVRA